MGKGGKKKKKKEKRREDCAREAKKEREQRSSEEEPSSRPSVHRALLRVRHCRKDLDDLLGALLRFPGRRCDLRRGKREKDASRADGVGVGVGVEVERQASRGRATNRMGSSE